MVQEINKCKKTRTFFVEMLYVSAVSFSAGTSEVMQIIARGNDSSISSWRKDRSLQGLEVKLHRANERTRNKNKNEENARHITICPTRCIPP